MIENLKAGQKKYTVEVLRGKARIRITFPIRIWEAVSWWWEELRWSPRAENRPEDQIHVDYITWLELVIDFELSTGVMCQRDTANKANWGTSAVLLKHIIKLLMLVRGTRGNLMKLHFGENKQTSSLACSGALKLEGLRRRPIFVKGESSTNCMARNAWAAGKASAEFDNKFQDHIVCYSGFYFGGEYMPAAIAKVLARNDHGAPALPRKRLFTKTRAV